MKIFTSLVLMLFCACFVCAQEKELPQAEIQQLYMDYFHSQIDEVKGMSPSEKQELYDCVDSLIKKYQIIPNRGNNTLRKIEYVKIFGEYLRLIGSKSSFNKFPDSKKAAYLIMTKAMMEHFFSMTFNMSIIGVENEQKLRKSLEKLEKRKFSYLVRQEKKKKNASPHFRIGKEILSSETNTNMAMYVFIPDEDFKKYKIIEKINSINTKDFEKNIMILGMLCPVDLVDEKFKECITYNFETQLEERLQVKPGTRKQQVIYIHKLRRDCFDQPMKEEPTK